MNIAAVGTGEGEILPFYLFHLTGFIYLGTIFLPELCEDGFAFSLAGASGQ
jgi:hypothetical protein